jgi:hypothetical protein
MMWFLKGFFIKEKNKDKEFLSFLMEVHFRVNLEIILLRDKASFNGLMEKYMKEIGYLIRCLVKEK